MKTYKSNLPEITLKYKTGDIKKVKISKSSDAAKVMRNFFEEDTIELTESFIAMYLNKANNSIGWIKISQGGIAGTVADVKIILGTALKCGASGIIMAHNHPSGNLNPSESDINLTRKIKHAAGYMEISLLDHLIITESGFLSMADEHLF